MLESKFISRAATFTFFLGDRFFGVITAYVAGDNAGLYHFTSSLPVQIVKFLKPTLSPLLNNTLPGNDITKPLAKVVIAENVKPVTKVVTNVKKVKPLAKAASTKSTKPLAKDVTPKNSKPLAKETAAKNTKLSANEKITTTDKNDSATRYYKYPIPPKLPQ